MKEKVEISLLPVEATDEELVRAAALARLGWEDGEGISLRLLRKSLDARGRRPRYRLLMEVYKGEIPPPIPQVTADIPHLGENPKGTCIVVGAGPAGYFAALELLEQGIRPIVLERGKDVRARRRDLRLIQQAGEVDPHSNYCFGEGGAGTYSDGKLYTRSHKRGDIRKSLRILVEHGAQSDILTDAQPHIGSNKLPKVVANIRESILRLGGEVRFGVWVTDFILNGGRMLGVIDADGGEHLADAVILATGHSARDIFKKLHQKGIRLEAKPFALGLRVEHPQALIDRIQYRQPKRETGLPAASYKLVSQVRGRGVFSFCMCPGGLVVPAATAPGEIVVNGMSLSRRDSAYANSGVVVAVDDSDLRAYAQHGVFAGLEFQKAVEQAMFAAGDGSQQAPALRMTDFMKGRLSTNLPDSSYIPGLFPAPLHGLLPEGIGSRLREAMRLFDKKMRGYHTREANVIGTESRTSSPIRIPRDKVTLMHVEVEALFPCGEGAGYAGGIISAAMDGQNVARAVGCFLLP